MKSILILALVLVSFSAAAYDVVCTSDEAYASGFSVHSEFSMPRNDDVSTRSYEHEGYIITIVHEAHDEVMSKFNLSISKNDAVLLDQAIELNNPINFESADFNYALECRIDVR